MGLCTYYWRFLFAYLHEQCMDSNFERQTIWMDFMWNQLQLLQICPRSDLLLYGLRFFFAFFLTSTFLSGCSILPFALPLRCATHSKRPLSAEHHVTKSCLLFSQDFLKGKESTNCNDRLDDCRWLDLGIDCWFTHYFLSCTSLLWKCAH